MRALALLTRPRLALLNGVAAAGGYLLFPGAIDPASLGAAMAGVVLLACGGSALNQVLERDLDSLMTRTMRRPLPRGDLSAASASTIAGGFIAAGLALLASAGGVVPMLFGAAALVWYLGVYTPLKRRTPLALAAGALCGALPPLIGWSLAGGEPGDYRIILLAGLLYLWQIPHFWLFQQRHAADYCRAGVPLWGGQGNDVTPAGLCRLWIFALAAASLLLPAFGIIEHHVALWYAAFPLPLIILSLLRRETALFSCLNLFPLLVTVALLVQK